jgi:hypothetical protein
LAEKGVRRQDASRDCLQMLLDRLLHCSDDRVDIYVYQPFARAFVRMRIW